MTPIAGSTDGSRGVDFHGWWTGMNLMILRDYELNLSLYFSLIYFLIILLHIAVYIMAETSSDDC